MNSDLPKAETAQNEWFSVTLEAMELEFALGSIDVFELGFDAALSEAAMRVGGTVLFNMPAIDATEVQRIGAVAMTGRVDDPVIFVTLHNDGTTLSVTPLTGNNSLFESLGRNYAEIMKGLSA